MNASHKTPALLLLVLAIALLAAPNVWAERFVVTMENGTTFETLRQPRTASWDSGVLMVLTDAGNWIGLEANQVAKVRARSEEQGFGRVIDAKTIEIGVLANDAPTDEELEEEAANQDPFLAALERIEELSRPPEQPQTTVEQFVNPEDTLGVPTSYGNSGLAQEYYGTGYEP